MVYLRRTLVIISLFTAITISGFSQTQGAAPQTGDAAVAEKYTLWAMDSIKNNHWTEAELALERASDYADVSSDLSYLLALCRSQLKRPRGAVFDALDKAIEADRWRHYEASQALLLKAEMLLEVKDYPGVIHIVNRLPLSADTMVLHLRALKGQDDPVAFQRLMTRALDLYPHDPRPVSVLFGYASSNVPKLNERALVDLALNRLSLLVSDDPSLGYKAAPFVRNPGDARRLVETYRAGGNPHPASLPIALKLGVIDEQVMIRDLFAYTTNQYSVKNQQEHVLDIGLIRSLWDLLRNNESREEFARNLSAFSGVIIEDRDNDSYPESYARYHQGQTELYSYDADQDGLPEIVLHFGDELPRRAEVVTMDDSFEIKGFSSYPLKADDRAIISLEYFRYPSVKSARLGQTEYFPVYREFLFAPVDFVSITGRGLPNVPLYPELNPSVSRLTKRSLISFSNIIKRPSRDFPEAIEEIHLTNSVVNRAREILPDGRMASEMFFELGQPYLQYIDLDMDGRRETRRLFKREPGVPSPGDDPTDYKLILEKSESDWDGDGMYEYGELHLPGGLIERSWDNDGDGIRESREMRPEV